jgi:hypothetical protein
MHIHLLSNASSDTFPHNTLGDFATILYTPLKLPEDDWEVGLAEMHIPFSMDMIRKEDAWAEVLQPESEPVLLEHIQSIDALQKYHIRIQREEEHYEVNIPDGILLSLNAASGGLPSQIGGNSNHVFIGQDTQEILQGPFEVYKINMKVTKHTFKEGYYETLKDLTNAIVIPNVTLGVTENGYAVCELKVVGTALRFSEHVANILGFRRESIHDARVIARHTMDPFPGLNCILVLTNFIQEGLVGDACVPLLRLLPLKLGGQRYHNMSYECHPIQYKKVMQKEIDCIRILLTDDAGRLLPFSDRGRVALTLHFRRYG